MPYNFIADSFHTKKLCNRPGKVQFYNKNGRLAFFEPPMGAWRQHTKIILGLKNLDRSYFHFVTMHAFDRQTHRQTDTFLIASPHWHSMQRGNNLG